MLLSLLLPSMALAQNNADANGNRVYLPLVASGQENAAVVQAAAVSLTNLGTAYTQDFNTLANSGTTATILPTDWTFSEIGTNANISYTVGTGSGTGGDTYSFGAAGSTDRAFGTLRSGSNNPTIGAQFTNNTGATITALDITYTGEQWRAGVLNRNAADRLDFQISTDATSLTTGTWTDQNSLDFNSANISTTVGALDGNATQNRTSVSFVIPTLAIANGATFWIRWNDFDISGADDGLAIDDFSLTPTGTSADSAPTVSSTTPANGAATVSSTSTIAVTFSEAVNADASSFAINCSLSGVHSAVVSGGPTTYTLDPDSDFVQNDNCSVTVNAANVTDQDANDPPDTMAADYTFSFTVSNPCLTAYTPIYAIQGTGASAAITGTVTTQGVVVGDYEGASPALRGFFIQDAVGDGNPATSDGIFVFEGSNANTVNLGDIVRVTGTAGENQGQSQVSVGTIIQCGSGTVTPTDVTFPVASTTFLEQFEGMLVRLPQTLYVSEHFQLGRFGQVLLSANGRLQQPTNVVAPGAAALALQAQNDLNKIILDDGFQNQNADPIVFGRGGLPLSASNTLRGGDTATGIVGLMTYTWAGNAASGNAYRVRPVNALGGSVNFEPTNPRPTAPPTVGGSLKVVGMNLLNFFNTFGTTSCTNGVAGAATDCRGADDAGEFARQWPKTVAAILAMNPDVLGVNELENDGYGSTSALQFLVDQLNAATAPGTYAFIDVDTATGQVDAMGSDAIKVALLYKPAMVTPVGQTAALNTVAFVNGGDSAPRNRASVAQAFQENSSGEVFIVNVNHLKSKGSACDAADAGDGQGNCSTVRVNAVNELMAWFATNPTTTGDPDILMIGDYNSYAMEDPITTLTGAGFTNLVSTILGSDAYSYVFDGQWGYLDQALTSASMVAQVAGVGDYHINADEPAVLDYNDDFKSAGQIVSLYAPDQFRVSDHDPVIIGLSLESAAPVAAPIQSPVANGAGWNNSDVTVNWNWTDSGSGIDAANCTTSSTSSGEGELTLTASCRDLVGNVGNASYTVKVDKLAPTSNPVQSPVANGAGWNNTDVTINWNWLDGGSGINTASCELSSTFGSEGELTSTVSCLDNASNIATASYTTKIDKTAPVVTLTGVSNGASYVYGSVPSAGCNTQDATSGVATVAALTVTGGNSDGTGNFTATCSSATDNAGNASAPVTVNYTVSSPGTVVGICGGYTVYRNGSSYIAPQWVGAIKVGTNSNNTIIGGSGADLILGLSGNDQITGNGGDDVICGGDGVDLLYGMNGNDLLDGGAGNDVLNGGNGDYDQLIAGAGNDTLLDGDGVLSAQGGAGNDQFTITLRNGWRNSTGQAIFAGLTAGYGNDTVGLVIRGTTQMVVDITGDERDVPASPLEGAKDKLLLAGAISATSTVIKFEQFLIISATADQNIPSDTEGAEYLEEVAGEEGSQAGPTNRVFLPVVVTQ